METMYHYTPYIYSPLNESRQETRVFSLDRSANVCPQDLLSFRMISISLEEDVEYHAISYVCGDISRQKPVLVNDCLLFIHESLEIVLRSFVDQYPQRVWWADALSINQQDLVEKGYQVAQLGTVYTKAYMVMIWLGPSNIESLEAMVAMIIILGVERQQYMIRNKIDDTIMRISAKGINLDQGLSSKFITFCHLPSSTLDKILRFFELPWWQRLWTLQECILARRAVVYCGTCRMGYRTLSQVCSRMFRFNHLCEMEHTMRDHLSLRQTRFLGDLATNNLAIMRILMSNERERPLLVRLVRTSIPHEQRQSWRQQSLEVTDPRDKIFALLSLSGDLGELRIKPEYTKSCEEVYIEASRSMIEAGYGNILTCVDSSSRSLNLPSWVHDWSRSPTMFSRTTFCYLQTGESDDFKSSLKVNMQEIDLGSRTISLLGHHVETVKDTVETCFPSLPLVSPQGVLDSFKEPVSNFVRLLARSDSSDTLSTSMLEACALTLTTGKHRDIINGKNATKISTEAACRGFRWIYEQVNPDYEARRLQEEYAMNLGLFASGRRPFVTPSGAIGLGPPDIRTGDEIISLYGVSVPMAVRREKEGGCYSVVGEVYLHNLEKVSYKSPDVYFWLL